jgi:DNA phosphorothioation-dependent restriction protein DptG
MGFIINENKYRSSFISAKGFTHNRGTLIKLFPFATDTTSLKDSIPDFKSFKGITGHFFRTCRNVSFKKNIDKQELLEKIVENVTTDYPFDLKSMLNELFFDEDNDIVLFDPEVLPHLQNKSANGKLKNLQSFIANLLVDQEVKEIVGRIFSDNTERNILYKLVLENLAATTISESKDYDKDGTYRGRIAMEILELFKKDIRHLVDFPKFFVENISLLLKYYYLQYIIRLNSQVNFMFDQQRKPTPLFYSLDWEKLSRSRFCLENGWNKLEKSMDDAFAHANCLELLNSIEGDYGCFSTNSPFTYEDIYVSVQNMPEEARNDLAIKIHRLTEDYVSAIAKVEKDNDRFNWDNYVEEDLPSEAEWLEHHPLKLIYRLFHLIRYQFINSGRNKPFSEYKLWFMEFVKSNYIKYRGSLGSSLKIERPLLLLLTEIAILSSGEDKVILNKLWADFERRGLYLDHESRKEIIIFFEKINMLEKKSDSGDAQYVKSLLTH